MAALVVTCCTRDITGCTLHHFRLYHDGKLRNRGDDNPAMVAPFVKDGASTARASPRAVRRRGQEAQAAGCAGRAAHHEYQSLQRIEPPWQWMATMVLSRRQLVRITVGRLVRSRFACRGAGQLLKQGKLGGTARFAIPGRAGANWCPGTSLDSLHATLHKRLNVVPKPRCRVHLPARPQHRVQNRPMGHQGLYHEPVRLQ